MKEIQMQLNHYSDVGSEQATAILNGNYLS
jgi:hypothetical protein